MKKKKKKKKKKIIPDCTPGSLFFFFLLTNFTILCRSFEAPYLSDKTNNKNWLKNEGEEAVYVI